MTHALQTCDLHAPAVVVYPRPAGGVLACPWCAERDADGARLDEAHAERDAARKGRDALARVTEAALNDAHRLDRTYACTQMLNQLHRALAGGVAEAVEFALGVEDAK